MTMLISFVIPHYNLPKELLTRCLASIAKQALPKEEHEIIIVDDGSKEPPVWVNDIYEPGNLKLVRTAHGGPGAARNRGMEEAQGQYIMFIDADDYLMPNNELAQCLEFLKKSDTQILRFRQVTSTGKTYPKPKKKIKFSNAVTGAMFMKKRNLPGSPCSYIFMRELAMNKGIKFPTNVFHEDEEFNTIIHYYASSVVTCNASLYYYCIREGSTTTNRSEAFIEGRLENMLHVIERIAFFRDTFYMNATEIQKAGINRKLATLAVDVIINMIYMGKSDEEILETCSTRLAKIDLYPLPKVTVSIKYSIFRRLANSIRGIKAIRLITLRNSSPKK